MKTSTVKAAHKYRILVIDPDRNAVQPLIDLLHECGHQTRRFAKIKTALKTKTKKHAFDAAIIAWPVGAALSSKQQLANLQSTFSCLLYLSTPAKHVADAANSMATHNVQGYLLRPYLPSEIHNRLLKDLDTARELQAERRQREATARANRLFQELNETAVAINQARYPTDVLSALKEKLRSMNLHYFIVRLSEDGNLLQVTNTSFDQEFIKKIKSQIKIKLLGFAIETGKLKTRAKKILKKKALGFRANAIEDLARLLQFPNLKQVLQKVDFPNRVIYAPLFFNEEVDGILVIFGDDLVSVDKPIFRAFSHQVSTALTEARLLEELTLHKHVSTQLNATQDTRKILKLITDSLIEVLGSQSTVSLMVYDRSVKEIQLAEASGSRSEKSLKIPSRSDGLAQTAMQRRVPVFSYEPGAPPLHPGAKADDVQIAMTIPLLDGNHVVGVLYADSLEGHSFSKHEVETAQFFASQATLALRGANYVEQLETVAKIATQISSEHDLGKLLDLICNKTAELLDADSCAILLLTEKDGRKILQIEGDWGLGSKIRQETQDILGSSIAGRVAALGKAIIANDIPNDKRFFNPAAEDEKFMAIASVPIIYKEQIIGTLDIHSKTRINVFTKNDLHILALMAKLATFAIENARKMNEVQITRQIGEDLTKLFSVQEVMQLFVERATELLGAGVSAALNVFDPTRQKFQTREVFGPRQQIILDSPPRVEGVAWKVYHDNKPIVLENAYKSSIVQHCVRADHVNSLVVVPVLGQEETPIGVLYADTIGESQLGERLPLLQILANQAGIAIERARLIERMAQEKKLVQSIAKATSILSDLQATWKEILLGAMDLTGAERGNISRVDDEQNVLKDLVREGQWDLENYIEHIELGGKKSIQGWVALNKKSVLIGNVETEEEWKDTYFRRAHDTRSELAVPILRGETKDLVGIINLESVRKGAFSENDKELLESLAVYADIAVQNAQLFATTQKSEKQLQMLTKIGREVSQSLELEQVLDPLYKRLRQIFGGQVISSVLLFDELGQQLHFLLSEEFDYEIDIEAQKERTGIELGEGICGWVALHKKPANVPDVTTDQRYLKLIKETRSELAVPIMIGERLVGVLDIESPRPNHFSEDDTHLLLAVANQVAAAISNAEQYGRRERQLAAIDEATKAIIKPIGRRETLQAILNEAARLTGANFATLQEIRGANLYFEAVYPARDKEKLFSHLNGDCLPLKGQGITAWVARTGKPLLVNNVRQPTEYDYIDGGFNTRSELTVPLFIEGRVWGVLNVEHPKEVAFDNEHLNVMQALASLAVVALQNAEKAEELSRINTVAVMGAWGADVLHDITREVGAIRRSIYMLQQVPDLSSNIEEQLLQMDSFAERLVLPELPDQPMVSNYPEAIGNEPNLDNTIRAELKNFQHVYPHITFRSKLQCNGVEVLIHKEWLRRLLRHLINNAIKAMQNKTRREITIRSMIQDNMAEVQVEDSGQGIEPEIVAILFNQPVHTNGHQGRGLLLVRFVTEQHGGTARLVWNKLNKGACFSFRIPFTRS